VDHPVVTGFLTLHVRRPQTALLAARLAPTSSARRDGWPMERPQRFGGDSAKVGWRSGHTAPLAAGALS